MDVGDNEDLCFYEFVLLLQFLFAYKAVVLKHKLKLGTMKMPQDLTSQIVEKFSDKGV